MQPAPQRRGHGQEHVDQAGHEDRERRPASDAPHADPIGSDVRGGRPRRAARPGGHHRRVQVCRRLVALDRGIAGDDALELGRQRQVDVGEQQADVELGPRLELEPAGLAVVEEHGRQAGSAGVLAHELGRPPGAGEEARVEVRELSPQAASHDEPGGAQGDRRTGLVEGSVRPHEKAARGRRRREGGAGRVAALGSGEGSHLGAPDAPRDDGDNDCEEQLQGDDDRQCEQQPVGPRRVVGVADHAALAAPGDAAQAVVHRLEPQHQRGDDRQQRWHPHVASEPPVQQPRRHEATRSGGVLQAVHPRQPWAGVGRAPVEDGAEVVGRAAGADTHDALARCGGEPQVDRARHFGPDGPEQLAHLGARHLGVPPSGQHQQPTVVACGESGDGPADGVVLVERARHLPGFERALLGAEVEEVAADDHEARPLPLVEGEGHVSGEGERRGRGVRLQEQVADDHHPAPEGHVEREPGCAADVCARLRGGPGPGGRTREFEARHHQGLRRQLPDRRDASPRWGARRHGSMLPRSGPGRASGGNGAPVHRR